MVIGKKIKEVRFEKNYNQYFYKDLKDYCIYKIKYDF